MVRVRLVLRRVLFSLGFTYAFFEIAVDLELEARFELGSETFRVGALDAALGVSDSSCDLRNKDELRDVDKLDNEDELVDGLETGNRDELDDTNELADCFKLIICIELGDGLTGCLEAIICDELGLLELVLEAGIEFRVEAGIKFGLEATLGTALDLPGPCCDPELTDA